MPVPKSTVENSPRKLLRDVVLEKMLAAIQDGTLQAGERLNDDELVAWLGVSRTPIREAIAKLVDYGLVEMEANRYTRIATPTGKQATDTTQVLGGFMEMAARWGVPQLDDDAAKALVDHLEAVRSYADAHDKRMDAEIEQVMLLLIRAADNQLLDKLSESLLPRARFLSLAQGPWEFWDYQHAVDPLRAAIAKRDGDGAAAAIRALTATAEHQAEELRAAGATS
ncbi:GntR family transcriptional regulator [Curtobacterium sp. NPDC089689]|uniref:GntR family transcriptional regulator n=1 Tax=Curtobacterium sp. NPDC089689 TaxID=3363968 RepID=UPI00380791A8